jgi:hypothetical protein
MHTHDDVPDSLLARQNLQTTSYTQWLSFTCWLETVHHRPYTDCMSRLFQLQMAVRRSLATREPGTQRGTARKQAQRMLPNWHLAYGLTQGTSAHNMQFSSSTANADSRGKCSRQGPAIARHVSANGCSPPTPSLHTSTPAHQQPVGYWSVVMV